MLNLWCRFRFSAMMMCCLLCGVFIPNFVSAQLVPLTFDGTGLAGSDNVNLFQCADLPDMKDPAFLELLSTYGISLPEPLTYESRNVNPETIRQDIIDYAKSFMNVPYRWGGASPDGFDCSGFIIFVFRAYGVEVPRVSRYQQRDAQPRDFDSLRAGDLIFFAGPTHVNHAGIVIRSEGEILEMIHSSSSLGVSVVNVYASSYWRPRLHSAGTYLELYDYFEENPEIIELFTQNDPEAVRQVQEIVKEIERKRKTRLRASFALRHGTGGLGGEFIGELYRGVHMRMGFSYLQDDSPFAIALLNTSGKTSYSGNMLSLLANVHVKKNMYMTGGVLYYRGENTFTYDDKPGKFRKLTIDPSKTEGLAINRELQRNFNPYLGFGLGRAMHHRQIVSASVEAGLMYHEGEVSTLTVTDGLTTSELAAQQALLKDRSFNLVPMLHVQLSVRIY
jgi:hypothetical protein